MNKKKKEQKMKFNTTERGITLVALVITIVILIILATVTINVAFGEGGLIERAQQAKNLTEQATQSEQEALNSLMSEYANIMAEEPEVPEPEPVVNEVDPEPVPDPEPQPGDPIDGTLAVGPQVADGMTPVKYINGTGWVKTSAVDEEWYNYGEKKWANIVLGGATFNTSGSYEVLDETKTYSMLVWIPRYAYKITQNYHTVATTTGNIDIVFLDTENKDKEGVDYSSKTTYPKVTGDGLSGYKMSDYVVHPAFTFGSELAGFWVGKFETSNNSEKIQIKGGVSSWQNITISDVYTNCRNMNIEGNNFNLSSDDSIVDPHMMKNTEWGAVAYLSQSKYGKNSEVTINTSSYTGGGSGTSYRTKQSQSTTGNITGVYDMSGGTWEFVAAYVGNGDSFGSSLLSAPLKYKDIYSSYTEPASGGIYGDAVYETSTEMSETSWYYNASYFPNSAYTFFVRGGAGNDFSGAGLFAFSDYNIGLWNYDKTFRVVVPVL